MITLGGNAELELVDTIDPFSEGIIFSVMPPKKSWKNISNLSGGEKTLSSLALVFALHVYKVRSYPLTAEVAYNVTPANAYSRLRCISWTRSMLRLTSETSQLSQIISRIERRTHNSSSFHFGNIIFLADPIRW